MSDSTAEDDLCECELAQARCPVCRAEDYADNYMIETDE